MGKTMCKVIDRKYLKKNLDDYVRMVKKSGWVCMKCGRFAPDKKLLCDAKEID
ncbi:MAG: hypothetical protein JW781_02885 [Deltaproteobacteria bacterium]|nr:hypothetical protein [Candidatus Anaeroferrophillacea bacterium]